MEINNNIIKTGKTELWYPGFMPRFRNGLDGFIHNLSSYGPEFDDGSSIEFDIERTIKWNMKMQLAPFTYSLMISYKTPLPENMKDIDVSRQKFRNTASQLKNFKLEDPNENYLIYRNHEQHDMFIDWIYIPNLEKKDITIGVIQDKKLPDFQTVLDSVPYAVEIFNKLSPKKLEDKIVQESIMIAKESDKIQPRSRIKEKEAYEQYCNNK